MKRSRLFQASAYLLIVTVCFFASSQISAATLYGATSSQAPEALTIHVLKGEDGVNIIKKKSAAKPVVEVRDRNNLPVAGATVFFILPESGPSATFADSNRALKVLTNSQGRASVTSMRPVETGPFKIEVTATYRGESATTTISQENFATVQAAQAARGASIVGGGGGLSGGAIGAIVAGAVAAAVGAAIVSKQEKPTTTAPPVTTIREGTISIGAGPTLSVPR